MEEEDASEIEQARDVISGSVVAAARTLAGIVARPGRNAMAQLTAAREILDRAGVAAKKDAPSATTINLIVVQAGAPTQPQSGQVLDITSLVRE